MNGPPENDLCSICHSHFTAPCQANCSHWFCGYFSLPLSLSSLSRRTIFACGNCIMLVWRHGSTLQPCKCPLCRRPISLLVPTEDTIRNRSDSSVSEVLANLETYNRYFGGRSTSLIQRMQDLPFLLRRLLREMMDPQRTLPLVIRARVYIAMILSVVYIVSPIDIIPEGVLGVVGLLDDLLIALICFLHVAALYRSVLYFRHTGS
uniref:DUF1232 domain-containing protein n=1 Tax=Brassica oleracea TaxID=3712 RepID=A0A3P6G0H7_BRAOL|nr:unnamed protein product [Brassica oleracea]